MMRTMSVMMIEKIFLMHSFSFYMVGMFYWGCRNRISTGGRGYVHMDRVKPICNLGSGNFF